MALPPINSGDLRHRIVIERGILGLSPGNNGERIPDFEEWHRCWAAINPVSGQMIEVAHSFSPTVSHRITIRHRTGIVPSFRIRWGVRIFAINGVLNLLEQRKWINLFCTEVLNPPTGP